MEPGGSRTQGPPGGSPGSLRARFDDVEVDEAAHVLSVDGQERTLEPKAFAVLLVLLRRAGELVEHDALLDAVWGHRHVTPGVVTRAISQLRAALGDDPHQPRYIQTQHALGYRFIGRVELAPDGHGRTPGEQGIAPRATDNPIDAPAGDAIGEQLRPQLRDAPDPETGAAVGAARRLYGSSSGRRASDSGDAVASSWRPGVPRRGALVLLGLLAAAALLVALWTQRPGEVPRPAEASVAVLPFASLSDDPADRYFAEGLAVEMHDALAGVPGLKVAAQPAAAARPNRDPRELGRTLGVAVVLDASVRREGSRMRVNAHLIDTATGFTLWSQRYDREASDVFELQGAIAAEVVRALPLNLPAERERLARRLAPTRDLAAYDLYLKGQSLLLGGAGQERMDEAIGFFRQALATDPRFARAQAGICRAEIRRFEAARDPDAFTRAQAACARASEMDAGLREVDLALGDLARVRGESQLAGENYARALDDVALRPAAYVGMARIETARGERSLALDYLERARQLRPGDAAIHREIGLLHYQSGDLPAAIEAYRIATTLDPDNPVLWASLGGLRLAHGDSSGAEQALERSLALGPGYVALSNLGTLRFGQQRYPEAAALFRQAAALDAEDFRVVGNIGDALAADPGTAGQAAASFRKAAGMAERYLAIRADDAQAMAFLAWYRANLGEAEAARSLAAQAEALGTETGEVALIVAQTLALLGDDAAARRRLAVARAHEVPESRIRASPQLRRLLAAGSGPG